MSSWRKMMLGPARSVACVRCGGAVSVKWTSLFAVIPLLLSIVIGPYMGSLVIAVALAMLGGVAMFLLHLFWVPIAQRSN